MGLWLAPITLSRQHDTRFDTEWRVCGMHPAFTLHHHTTTEPGVQ